MGRLLVMDLDGEVRAEQFALHAFDAIFRSRGCDQKDIHLQDILRAEFDADTASFAVSLDNFESGTTHSDSSPLYMIFRVKLGNFAAQDSMIVCLVPQQICIHCTFSRVFNVT
jgi:hypothetical protein